MALIKRYQIQDKGEIILEKRPMELSPQARLEREVIEPVVEMELPRAQSEAAKILSQARMEAEKLKNQAREEGLAQGKGMGQKEVEQKIKEALETLNQAVKEREKIIKDAEAEILRLALKAAEQIIRSEVSLHRDVCLNIVSEAINRVSDREQVIVRVNREDAEYIKKYKDRLAGIVDGVKSFSVLEDSQIEPGGCVIETNLGYVDARISTKLAALEEALKKAAE
ncbi:MAG: FliH/SctL family protein [Candidatus Margulisiibacteriota bacterium]